MSATRDHSCRGRRPTAVSERLAAAPPAQVASHQTPSAQKRRALTLAATSAGLLVVNPETEVRDLRAVVNDLRRVAEYRLSADKQQAGLRSSRALGS
jgi:hypothetical protein